MKIKESPEDFIVEEITPEGKTIKVGEKTSWKDGKGDYLIFVLEKKNWNTIEALKEIAIRAHSSKKRFSFAGTKDRRAITTQRASAWKISKEQLENIKIKDLEIKPVSYEKNGLHLGDLKGNRFTIRVKEPGEMRNPKSKIPNFFGEQRFGKKRPVTHLVGKAIVNEQYQRAVETYLWECFPEESEEEKEARTRLAKEKNFSEALKYFPRHLKYERTLLGHLSNKPNDYVGALNALPRKLLLLFVHAYQSHLFNKILTKRKTIGLEPKEGDILEDGIPTGPLYGYELELATGKQGEIEKETLSQEWLNLSDFKLHGMPSLSSKGLRRKLYFDIKDFKVLEKKPDELTVRFTLSKGVYATTVLNYLFGSAKAPHT